MAKRKWELAICDSDQWIMKAPPVFSKRCRLEHWVLQRVVVDYQLSTVHARIRVLRVLK
jgi:hypothetical protein